MTTPPSLAPPDQLSDTTRQRILEAAEEVFADRGFDGATVGDITEKAGANRAAINYHFGGKQKLYEETLMFAHQNCVSSAEIPNWANGTPPDQKLRDFIRAVMARMLEIPRPSSLRLMTREMTEPTPAGAAAVEAYIRPMADRLQTIVGELLPDVSPEKGLMIGFSIMGQCLFYRQNRAIGVTLFGDAFESLDAATLATHIADFTLTGLGTDRPLGESSSS